MSERDGDRHGSAIAIAVTTCFLIVALIGWYEGFKKGQESHQSHSATAYENQTDNEIGEQCSLQPTVSSQKECMSKAVRATREQQRAEEDLDAQQQMAEWARWMLIFTVIMAAITAVGVFFVWKTLTATQEMAKDAKLIGDKTVAHAETSADATVKMMKLSHHARFRITRSVAYKSEGAGLPIPDFTPGEHITGHAFAVNFGRFAATLVRSDCRFEWMPGGILPMNHAYHWMGKGDFNNLRLGTMGRPGFDTFATSIPSGQHGVWTLHTVVPDNFSKADSGWSHDLMIVGFVSFIGEAEDPRAFYFCKRYVPAHQQFEDAEEYENED